MSKPASGSFRTVPWLLMLCLGLLLPVVPDARAAKEIVVDWSTGEVTVERDEPLAPEKPEPPVAKDCCREAERLGEKVREQRRLLLRQQRVNQKLKEELAEEERISRRLNDLLRTCR